MTKNFNPDFSAIVGVEICSITTQIGRFGCENPNCPRMAPQKGVGGSETLCFVNRQCLLPIFFLFFFALIRRVFSWANSNALLNRFII